MPVVKGRQYLRAETPQEIDILFQEALASLQVDYMYMHSFEEDGITYDSFKHKHTRKYIFIPKRGDGLRLTEECAS